MPNRESGSVNLAPLRVLLVEDNPAHAELVEQLLQTQERPVVCIWKKTLADAMHVVESDALQAVLLDLILPDSALPEQTLERMLDIARGAPIVVLTSVDDAALGREAVKRGAQDYLVKSSLSADLLVRTLEYAIERKRYAAEIERSNRDLQHFSYVVAHELRSPLAVMIGSVDLLMQRHDKDLTTGVREGIAQFRESAQELSKFLSELLSFATLGGDFDIEPVRPNEVVAGVLRTLQPELARTRATVTVEPLPMVLTARTMLAHVFQNLISNALKYHSDRAPQVKISSEARPEAFSFHVQDNGVGMSPEDTRRAFEMFARADRRSRAGFGIGLAFCKQALERLGGTISAESQVGVGTRFTFTLPRIPTPVETPRPTVTVGVGA